MTTTQHKPLGELYLGTLAENSSYHGLGGIIALAVSNASDPVESASDLVRQAMGTLEHCISLISEDGDNDSWSRIDAFFDNPTGPEVGIAWVTRELRQQSYRVLQIWEDHAVNQRKADAQRGIDSLQTISQEIHALWIADLYVAGHLLQAASRILVEVSK